MSGIADAYYQVTANINAWDANGNLATGYSGPVTLTFDSDPISSQGSNGIYAIGSPSLVNGTGQTRMPAG